MGGKERANAAKENLLAEGPWEHGGDHFVGVGNFQGGQWICRAVDDAHFGRGLPEKAREVGAGHFRWMQLGNQEVEGSWAGLSKSKGLRGVASHQNEKAGAFENSLDVLAQGVRVFHE